MISDRCPSLLVSRTTFSTTTGGPPAQGCIYGITCNIRTAVSVSIATLRSQSLRRKQQDWHRSLDHYRLFACTGSAASKSTFSRTWRGVLHDRARLRSRKTHPEKADAELNSYSIAWADRQPSGAGKGAIACHKARGQESAASMVPSRAYCAWLWQHKGNQTRKAVARTVS